MNQDNAPTRNIHLAGYLVGFGFLALAVALLTVSPMIQIPIEPPVLVSHEDLKPGAFRENLTDPPLVRIGSVEQRCNNCHVLFTNVREDGRPLTQHTDIVLNHGLNDGCLNCHDKGDREKLTLRSGQAVGYDNAQRLCAECHGPIYRDWQSGAHGKTIGYWDQNQGEAIKLTCTQCHDPHSPAYAPMEPLPGPRTLRMGDPKAPHAEGAIDPRNPLQRWLLEDADGHDSNHEPLDTQTHDEGEHE
ncbi:MAG: hypothetical protein ACI89L_002290 [Phycisphaerales bacterium]